MLTPTIGTLIAETTSTEPPSTTLGKKPARRSKRSIGRVRASELALTTTLREKVSSALAPIEAWATIDTPEAYLESRVGKYIAGLEMLLERSLELSDIAMARGLIGDLIRLTKIGRAKADLNITGPSKLRDEIDLTKIPTDKLRELLGRQE